LALALSATLVAVATRDTNAYFTDVHSGTMSGTLGSWAKPCPYRLAPGTAKAQHWDNQSCGTSRASLIAQCDKSGALSLDFGDALGGQCMTWSDVFRVVSLVDDRRSVSFSVSGAMAAFVTAVRLNGCGSATLAGHATADVYVAVSIPDRARPGEYSGTLTVHMAGSTKDTQLPMGICVRTRQRACKTEPARRQSAPKPSTTITATPSPSTTPKATAPPTPSSSPTPSSPPTPSSSPTPASPTPTGLTPNPAPSPSGGTGG